MRNALLCTAIVAVGCGSSSALDAGAPGDAEGTAADGGTSDAQPVADAGPVRDDAAAPDADPPDLGPADAGTVPDLVRLLAVAECARNTRCIPVSMDFFGVDEAACVVQAMRTIEPAIAAIAAGVADQRVGFDADRARACAASIETSDCELGIDQAVCRGMFTGTRRARQGCFVDGECGPGLYCQPPPEAVGCSYSPLLLELEPLACMNPSNGCGVCTPYAQPGAPCYSNQGCDDAEAVCRNVGSAGSPRFLCVARGDLGAACGGEVGACRHLIGCVGSPGAQTCQREAGLGEACDDRQVRAPRCSGPRGLVCSSTGTCARGAAIVGVGEDCDDVTAACAIGAYCNTRTRQCTALPGAGRPCLQGLCGTDARCVQGRCEALGAPGEACTTWSECADGQGCRGLDGMAASCGGLQYQSCAP